MIQSKTLFIVRFQKKHVFYRIFYQEKFSANADCTITTLIIRRLSNKSNGSRSLMDSFSSTKSWLIKKAGWSKSNKNSKKSKVGKSNSFNTSIGAKDVSKENNILDNIDTKSDQTNEPIVNKQIINESFDKPSSETMEEKSLFR